MHAAARLAEGETWPDVSWYWMAVNGGGVVALTWVVTILDRVVTGTPGLAIKAAVISAAVLLAAPGWYRGIRAARCRARADQSKSDTTARLRIVGPLGPGDPLAGDAPDTMFEPLVVMALGGVHWQRSPSPHRARANTLPPRLSPDPRPDRARLWARVALFVLGAAGVQLVERCAIGSGNHYTAFIIWASFGVGSLLAALLWPTYVRVVPGVLDVFRYGPLGVGAPRVERYDLRSARVLVRADMGVRVEDPTRSDAPVVYLHAKLLRVDARELAATVIAAARTRLPTPPVSLTSLDGEA